MNKFTNQEINDKEQKQMQHLTNNRALWARVGAIRGLIAGGLLSVLYLLIPLILVLIFVAFYAFTKVADPSATGSSTVLEMVGGLLFFGAIYVVVGIAIGVVPALIVGSLSGAIIGMLLSLHAVTPHWVHRLLVGVGTAAAGIALLSILLLARLSEGNEATGFFVFVGIPSIPYLGACIYLSLRLPRWIEQEQTIIEVPVGEKPYLPS
jgi:hypothetical protein